MIEAIRPVAPTRLFVACDGPNPERPGEAEKVAATRAVIQQEIDWPCQIERLYSDGSSSRWKRASSWRWPAEARSGRWTAASSVRDAIQLV